MLSQILGKNACEDLYYSGEGNIPVNNIVFYIYDFQQFDLFIFESFLLQADKNLLKKKSFYE